MAAQIEIIFPLGDIKDPQTRAVYVDGLANQAWCDIDGSGGTLAPGALPHQIGTDVLLAPEPPPPPPPAPPPPAPPPPAPIITPLSGVYFDGNTGLYNLPSAVTTRFKQFTFSVWVPVYPGGYYPDGFTGLDMLSSPYIRTGNGTPFNNIGNMLTGYVRDWQFHVGPYGGTNNDTSAWAYEQHSDFNPLATQNGPGSITVNGVTDYNVHWVNAIISMRVSGPVYTGSTPISVPTFPFGDYSYWNYYELTTEWQTYTSAGHNYDTGEPTNDFVRTGTTKTPMGDWNHTKALSAPGDPGYGGPGPPYGDPLYETGPSNGHLTTPIYYSTIPTTWPTSPFAVPDAPNGNAARNNDGYSFGGQPDNYVGTIGSLGAGAEFGAGGLLSGAHPIQQNWCIGTMPCFARDPTLPRVWPWVNEFTGCVAELWYAPGVFMDLTDPDVRRKFSVDRGDGVYVPVQLGANGELPTGSPPLVYLSGDYTNFHINRADGIPLSIAGALLPCADGGPPIA